RTSLCYGEEFSAAHKQIDQRTRDEQLVRVLLQPAIAYFHEAELQLHHLKHVLHFGPNLRFRPVLPPRHLIHDLTFVATTPLGEILRSRRTLADHLGLSLIGAIAPHPGFFAVQQVGQDGHIGNVGRRHHCRVDDLALAVDPHMRLHSEVASRPRDLPPQPLSDPYVTLSRHTAPVIQPHSLPHSSGKTASVLHSLACAATARWLGAVPIGLYICAWPIVPAPDQCAYQQRAWLLDRMLRSSSTTLG